MFHFSFRVALSMKSLMFVSSVSDFLIFLSLKVLSLSTCPALNHIHPEHSRPSQYLLSSVPWAASLCCMSHVMAGGCVGETEDKSLLGQQAAVLLVSLVARNHRRELSPELQVDFISQSPFGSPQKRTKEQTVYTQGRWAGDQELEMRPY